GTRFFHSLAATALTACPAIRRCVGLPMACLGMRNESWCVPAAYHHSVWGSSPCCRVQVPPDCDQMPFQGPEPSSLSGRTETRWVGVKGRAGTRLLYSIPVPATAAPAGPLAASRYNENGRYGSANAILWTTTYR